MFAKAASDSKLTDDALLALAWACSIGHTYLDGACEENVHGTSLIALPAYDVSMVHSQKPDSACERRLRREGQLSKEADCSYGCEDVLDILGTAFAVGGAGGQQARSCLGPRTSVQQLPDEVFLVHRPGNRGGRMVL